MQASQPVQLSARTTASSFGSFLRALPAPLAMSGILTSGEPGRVSDRIVQLLKPSPGAYATRLAGAVAASQPNPIISINRREC